MLILALVVPNYEPLKWLLVRSASLIVGPRPAACIYKERNVCIA
jgi:hypothetical protein